MRNEYFGTFILCRHITEWPANEEHYVCLSADLNIQTSFDPGEAFLHHPHDAVLFIPRATHMERIIFSKGWELCSGPIANSFFSRFYTKYKLFSSY